MIGLSNNTKKTPFNAWLRNFKIIFAEYFAKYFLFIDLMYQSPYDIDFPIYMRDYDKIKKIPRRNYQYY